MTSAGRQSLELEDRRTNGNVSTHSNQSTSADTQPTLAASHLNGQQQYGKAGPNGTPVATGFTKEDMKTVAEEGPVTVVPTSPPQPPPIPNGDLQAWLQVLGSFFMFFNTWGLINSYGAFQTYYMDDLLRDHSASDVAWIGSIQSFLVLFVGTIVGPIYDAGHLNMLIRVGSVGLVLGMMLTSLCTELWQFVLAQGILTGIGGGFLYLPSIAIIPQYFTTRKSLALGLASTGSSIGGIIYPIAFHRLQPTIGFPWATRVCGFIALSTCFVSVFTLRVRVYPSTRRKLLQFSAYRSPAFLLNQLAGCLGFLGFFAPFVYVEAYALAQPNANESLAFYLLPLLLAGSFFGRIIPNIFADRTGPFAVITPATLISGILAFAWIRIHSTAGLIAFTILFGFFSGSLVSVTPLTVVAITSDMRDIGTRLGMFIAAGAFMILIGTPIQGAILNDTGEYLGVQIFCGVCLIVGALLWIPTSWLALRMRKDHTVLASAPATANANATSNTPTPPPSTNGTIPNPHSHTDTNNANANANMNMKKVGQENV